MFMSSSHNRKKGAILYYHATGNGMYIMSQRQLFLAIGFKFLLLVNWDNVWLQKLPWLIQRIYLTGLIASHKSENRLIYLEFSDINLHFRSRDGGGEQDECPRLMYQSVALSVLSCFTADFEIMTDASVLFNIPVRHTESGTRSDTEVLFISVQKFLLQYFSCLAALQL